MLIERLNSKMVMEVHKKEGGMVVDISERGGVIPTVVYRRHLMISHTRHRDAPSSSRAFRTFLSFCTYLYSQRCIFNSITVDYIFLTSNEGYLCKNGGEDLDRVTCFTSSVNSGVPLKFH